MAPIAPATPVSPPPLALDPRLIQGNLREHTRYQAGSGQGASITGGCLPRAPSSQHMFGEGMWTRKHVPLHPDSRGRCRAPSNLRRRSALAPHALSIIRSRESEPCCWATPTKRTLGSPYRAGCAPWTCDRGHPGQGVPNAVVSTAKAPHRRCSDAVTPKLGRTRALRTGAEERNLAPICWLRRQPYMMQHIANIPALGTCTSPNNEQQEVTPRTSLAEAPIKGRRAATDRLSPR